MSQDIPETQLCELAGWFRALAGERRRLLKRYRASRLKAEALDAGGEGITESTANFLQRPCLTTRSGLPVAGAAVHESSE